MQTPAQTLAINFSTPLSLVFRGIECIAYSIMLIGAPLAPFAAAAIAGDWSFVTKYPSSLAQFVRHTFALNRARMISRYLTHLLTPRDTEDRIEGECTHCGRCCAFESCIFLRWQPDGRSACRIYGSRVFKLLSCGKFPISRVDIVTYQCPSFRSTALKAIPIVVQRG